MSRKAEADRFVRRWMYNVGSLDFFEITAISLREQETTEHRGTATREHPRRETFRQSRFKLLRRLELCHLESVLSLCLSEVGGGVVSGMPTLERQEVSAPSWETCLRLPNSPFKSGTPFRWVPPTSSVFSNHQFFRKMGTSGSARLLEGTT
jgi:hypothetical protein